MEDCHTVTAPSIFKTKQPLKRNTFLTVSAKCHYSNLIISWETYRMKAEANVRLSNVHIKKKCNETPTIY